MTPPATYRSTESAYNPKVADQYALPVRERVTALDVLRGIAVGGILLANVIVFFGMTFLSREQLTALATTTADNAALWFEHIFIDQKFYSIFSLLFGIGFGIQLSRGGDAALPRFRRRLRILLAIGAIHAFFIWAGDILMLYALLGFTLPWFARKSNRDLLKWTAILLATPTVLYAIVYSAWLLTGPHAPAASSGVPAQIYRFFENIGRGGIRDAFIGNLVFLGGRWADLFATVRFPKVLGMFVLGLWTVRTGIAVSPADHRETLKRWRAIGWAIGLPANIAAAWIFARASYLPPSGGGMIGTALQGIGVPLLAIGYAATVGLLVVDGRRLITMFAPVGRMALTNYLMHSLICVTLSYGFGFGMWWHTGPAKAMAIGVAIIAVQIPLSAWWLSRYRYGPIEWIWRRLTYRRPIAMVIDPVPSR
ncbi:MAG TPA: DUF418 domain-containing protein [Gemmatimonadaceae bacterium]|jgi:uncharacterized protein|nr:DUF418 domain-containing protein [Gemmatimonadaceae bacterium]